MQTAHGIVLRLTKLTETSLIVTWCVEGVGLVKTVAKGARRPKNVFFGKLDLFFVAELSWVESRKSELGNLRELVVRDYMQELRLSYKKTLVAGYFTSLVESVTEVGSVGEDFYGLLVRALQYLQNKDPELRAVIHFEKELAKLLGVWDGGREPHHSLRRSFGSLPKNRDSCLNALV